MYVPLGKFFCFCREAIFSKVKDRCFSSASRSRSIFSLSSSVKTVFSAFDNSLLILANSDLSEAISVSLRITLMSRSIIP